jgi:tRNA pseudouridine38-40 synthase
MQRWKLTIEYDGGAFCGWQKQAEVTTVQQVIEEAIEKFSGEKAGTCVAGRTDTGVHALGQVAHFDLAKETTGETVRDALNFHVKPHKIAILQAEAVPEDFNARFSAKARSYRYQIVNRRAPSVLLADYAWHIAKPLDVAAMQKAADMLIGKHDFSTFRAVNCQSSSPIRTLDLLKLSPENELIHITTQARSFLYHQVRNMVGTLSMVGTGQWSLEEFKDAFDAKDRRRGGPNAPPQGLFFLSVIY